ncbi:MAG: hypothetical protein ACRCX2_34030 [Paraclostridium sp.]
MNKIFEEMTYKEFISYCNDRACDGRWGRNEASNCIAIIDIISSIETKGLFKKRKTEKAREDAWQKLLVTIREEI